MKNKFFAFVYFAAALLLLAAFRPKENAVLVRLADVDSTFVFDLRYATENNMMKFKAYPVAVALLRPQTAEKLKKAQQAFRKMGYRIKIWDAYRPLAVQKELWKVLPDPKFVADPKTGSVHNRGCAVDMTLVDSTGQELKMPSEFDEMSEKAHRNYTGSDAEIRQNLMLLNRVMTESGFELYIHEWWHFNDLDWKTCPLLDEPLEKYVKK